MFGFSNLCWAPLAADDGAPSLNYVLYNPTQHSQPWLQPAYSLLLHRIGQQQDEPKVYPILSTIIDFGY